MIDKHSLSVPEYKRLFPEEFSKIIDKFGGRDNIFDMRAAINLWLDQQSIPMCEICSKKLTITKKFRNIDNAVMRCKDHINTNNLIKLEDILAKQTDIITVNVTNLPNYITRTTQLTLICGKHGEYIQSVGYFLDGGNCQQCYHEVPRPQILVDEWIIRSTVVHDSFYDYSMSVFVSSDKTVTIGCPIHGEFIQNAGVHMRGHGCRKCAMEKTTFKSATEYEIIDFLKEHNITNINHSDHSLGFELDIYLPEHNLAIEYNGIYWHSSGDKSTDAKISKQHLVKTEACERAGITLLHIMDLEWNDPIQRNIWKSTILHKLGLTKTRIFARKCNLVVVNHRTAKEFFNNNHLQGHAMSYVNVGLMYENQLVLVASFAKARFSKESNTYEIIRFASLAGTTVVGGFQKVIAEFCRSHSGTIISYANRRWSQGNVYSQSGFELASISGPCYYYTDCKKLWHRSIFQKHKLKDKLLIFDNEKTEVENMYENKYRRIWDCGHMKYRKII